jgi:hypothetical protein
MRRVLLAFLISWTLFLAAQEGGKAPAGASPNALDAATVRQFNEIIHHQFGDSFSLADSSPTPFVTGDFDNDGIEDVAFAAHSKKVPMINSPDYRLIDPYDDFFGYGDPRITSSFANNEPGRTKFLLIIHGSGPEAWRAPSPKSKFVIINLPFDRLVRTSMLLKKKRIVAISTEETASVSAVLFWNGKRYRWEPLGSSD